VTRLTTILVATALLFMVCDAIAENSTVGVTITSDRDPDKFADPKDTKYEINGAHTFSGGLLLGGSFQYNDRAFSDRASQNLEGIVGRQIRIDRAFSMTCSAGLGEHWREHPSTDFPYYVLRVAADFEINEIVTWNVVSLRYRDSFDTNDHYRTPQIATGFAYKVNERSSISVKIMRNWRDGDPSSTGVSLGFKQSF
jgi:hypothetical protein